MNRETSTPRRVILGTLAVAILVGSVTGFVGYQLGHDDGVEKGKELAERSPELVNIHIKPQNDTVGYQVYKTENVVVEVQPLNRTDNTVYYQRYGVENCGYSGNGCLYNFSSEGGGSDE